MIILRLKSLLWVLKKKKGGRRKISSQHPRFKASDIIPVYTLELMTFFTTGTAEKKEPRYA